MFNHVRHILPVPVCLWKCFPLFFMVNHRAWRQHVTELGLLIMMLILILIMMLRLMFAFRCCLPISWRQPLTAVAWDSGSCPRETCSPPLTWRWVFWGLLWLGQRQIYENVDNGSKIKTIVLAQGGLVSHTWHGSECFEKTWWGQRYWGWQLQREKMMDLAQSRLVCK